MKKVLALFLCLTAVLTVFAGCTGFKFEEADKTSKKQEDKGATVSLYMSSEIYNFDPIEAYTDEAAQQVLGLIYEGLFTINAKGQREKTGCKSYEIVDKDKEHYIEFTIRESYWSDGRQVQAADYVFAIKRMVETESVSEAASMLMYIENAYDIKHASGDRPLSIDDLGVTDEGTTVLKIKFDESIDYEAFLDFMASPYMVPLREDCVNKAEEWATNPSIFNCNGPFFVRSFTPGEKLVLERNTYYDRDPEEDSLKKSVKPYRLSVNFNATAEENFTAYVNGELYLDSELPLAERTAQASEIKTVSTNTMSELTLLFNTTDELLSNAKLRKALSVSLDRQQIADILVYATPATGIVTQGVFETNSKNKTMFADNSGTLISSTADVSTAKSLVSEAGAAGKTITVTYRPTEADTAVFNYIKGVWEGLGLVVEGKCDLTYTYIAAPTETDYDTYTDDFQKAYAAGNYQVMLYDLTMISSNAFSVLAPFAKEFSGNAISLTSYDSDEIVETPHVSGYDSEAYNTLIAEAYAYAEDSEAKAAKLHEAEKLLVEDCPIAPLAVYQRYYMVSDQLSGLKTGSYGILDFQKVTRKDYKETTAVAETKAAEETTAE